MTSRSWTAWLPVIVAPILGIGSIILPVVLLHLPLEPATIGGLTLLRSGIEHVNWLTLVFLFLSGVILSSAFRNPASWLASFLVLSPLPVMTLAEGMIDSTSHNLWPLEWLFYGVLTLISIVGAGCGVMLRRRLAARVDV